MPLLSDAVVQAAALFNDAMVQGAARRGRKMAEEAFLEYHGRWTMDLVPAAVDLFRAKLKDLRIPLVGAETSQGAAAATAQAFEARLREQVAGGQHRGGRA